MSVTKIETAFWDTSALVPLACAQGVYTVAARKLARKFRRKIAWWATSVEANSSLQRLYGEDELNAAQLATAMRDWEIVERSLLVIDPTERLRGLATTFPAAYDLRALDALQLAAAVVWCNEKPRRRPFVCFDKRLAEAARKAGFTIHTS